MTSFQTKLSIQIFQNELGDDAKGLIMMLTTYQSSVDKKFLKLPS